eukprot:Clim_evm29s210 gene=Clim_evmTU29s210
MVKDVCDLQDEHQWRGCTETDSVAPLAMVPRAVTDVLLRTGLYSWLSILSKPALQSFISRSRVRSIPVISSAQNGTLVAVASEDSIEIFREGEISRKASIRLGARSRVLAWSPEGAVLALLYDLFQQQRVAIYDEYQTQLYEISLADFAADGTAVDLAIFDNEDGGGDRHRYTLLVALDSGICRMYKLGSANYGFEIVSSPVAPPKGLYGALGLCRVTTSEVEFALSVGLGVDKTGNPSIVYALENFATELSKGSPWQDDHILTVPMGRSVNEVILTRVSPGGQFVVSLLADGSLVSLKVSPKDGKLSLLKKADATEYWKGDTSVLPTIVSRSRYHFDFWTHDSLFVSFGNQRAEIHKVDDLKYITSINHEHLVFPAVCCRKTTQCMALWRWKTEYHYIPRQYLTDGSGIDDMLRLCQNWESAQEGRGFFSSFTSEESIQLEFKTSTLGTLKQTEPTMLVMKLVEQKKFSEAKGLAEQYEINTEPILKLAWTTGSNDALSPNEESFQWLVLVNDPDWIATECIQKPGGSTEATQMKLDFFKEFVGDKGIREYSEEIKRTEERLKCYGAVLEVSRGHFLAQEFVTFRNCDIVAEAMYHAREVNFGILKVLFANLGPDLAMHYLPIIMQIPEYVDIDDLVDILPVFEDGQVVYPFDADVHDGSEVDTGHFLYEDPMARAQVEKTGVDAILYWYQKRAEVVEERLGDIALACKTLQQAIATGFEGNLRILCKNLQWYEGLLREEPNLCHMSWRDFETASPKALVKSLFSSREVNWNNLKQYVIKPRQGQMNVYDQLRGCIVELFTIGPKRALSVVHSAVKDPFCDFSEQQVKELISLALSQTRSSSTLESLQPEREVLNEMATKIGDETFLKLKDFNVADEVVRKYDKSRTFDYYVNLTDKKSSALLSTVIRKGVKYSRSMDEWLQTFAEARKVSSALGIRDDEWFWQFIDIVLQSAREGSIELAKQVMGDMNVSRQDQQRVFLKQARMTLDSATSVNDPLIDSVDSMLQEAPDLIAATNKERHLMSACQKLQGLGHPMLPAQVRNAKRKIVLIEEVISAGVVQSMWNYTELQEVAQLFGIHDGTTSSRGYQNVGSKTLKAAASRGYKDLVYILVSEILEHQMESSYDMLLFVVKEHRDLLDRGLVEKAMSNCTQSVTERSLHYCIQVWLEIAEEDLRNLPTDHPAKGEGVVGEKQRSRPIEFESFPFLAAQPKMLPEKFLAKLSIAPIVHWEDVENLSDVDTIKLFRDYIKVTDQEDKYMAKPSMWSTPEVLELRLQTAPDTGSVPVTDDKEVVVVERGPPLAMKEESVDNDNDGWEDEMPDIGDELEVEAGDSEDGSETRFFGADIPMPADEVPRRALFEPTTDPIAENDVPNTPPLQEIANISMPPDEVPRVKEFVPSTEPIPEDDAPETPSMSAIANIRRPSDEVIREQEFVPSTEPIPENDAPESPALSATANIRMPPENVSKSPEFMPMVPPIAENDAPNALTAAEIAQISRPPEEVPRTPEFVPSTPIIAENDAPETQDFTATADINMPPEVVQRTQYLPSAPPIPENDAPVTHEFSQIANIAMPSEELASMEKFKLDMDEIVETDGKQEEPAEEDAATPIGFESEHASESRKSGPETHILSDMPKKKDVATAEAGVSEDETLTQQIRHFESDISMPAEAPPAEPHFEPTDTAIAEDEPPTKSPREFEPNAHMPEDESESTKSPLHVASDTPLPEEDDSVNLLSGDEVDKSATSPPVDMLPSENRQTEGTELDAVVSTAVTGQSEVRTIPDYVTKAFGDIPRSQWDEFTTDVTGRDEPAILTEVQRRLINGDLYSAAVKLHRSALVHGQTLPVPDAVPEPFHMIFDMVNMDAPSFKMTLQERPDLIRNENVMVELLRKYVDLQGDVNSWLLDEGASPLCEGISSRGGSNSPMVMALSLALLWRAGCRNHVYRTLRLQMGLQGVQSKEVMDRIILAQWSRTKTRLDEEESLLAQYLDPCKSSLTTLLDDCIASLTVS